MRYGLAVKEIAPPFHLPMYGYGARKDAFDGVNDPLTFTALILEEAGRRALIGATDLGSFPNDGRTPELMERLGEIVGCPMENVLLNASHTHGGPLVPMGNRLLHQADAESAPTAKYEAWLFDRIAAATHEACGNLRAGTLWLAEGRTTIPLNRRPDRNGNVPNAPNPDGPVDNRLFCFMVRDTADQLAAVGVRISCHPVATGAQHRLTADFPGAWKAECARAFGPNVVPFFLQGAGADARPRHVSAGDRWRTMDPAELPRIGRDLMSEALSALTGPRRRKLGPLVLRGAFREVSLPCEKRYATREDLQRADAPAMKRYTEACHALLDAGKSIPDHQTFHVQTLWLDKQLALIGVDGEVLCGTGTVLEAGVASGQGLVLGYSNGVIAYLPDTHEMARGGYETASYMYQPWTGPLLPGLEHRLAAAVLQAPPQP